MRPGGLDRVGGPEGQDLQARPLTGTELPLGVVNLGDDLAGLWLGIDKPVDEDDAPREGPRLDLQGDPADLERGPDRLARLGEQDLSKFSFSHFIIIKVSIRERNAICSNPSGPMISGDSDNKI